MKPTQHYTPSLWLRNSRGGGGEVPVVGGDGLCHLVAEEHAAVDKVLAGAVHCDIAEVDKPRTAQQLWATWRYTAERQ